MLVNVKVYDLLAEISGCAFVSHNKANQRFTRDRNITKLPLIMHHVNTF
jgi:hypothetical protein